MHKKNQEQQILKKFGDFRDTLLWTQHCRTDKQQQQEQQGKVMNDRGKETRSNGSQLLERNTCSQGEVVKGVLETAKPQKKCLVIRPIIFK